MASAQNTESVEYVLNQLSIARNELKNLRQQIGNLKHSYKQDVNDILAQLSGGSSSSVEGASSSTSCNCELAGWRSIGVIKTWFPGKRGVPRQASLCPEAEGVLTLSSVVINNPAYSLSGLEEFSHAWILYHFHETDGKHVRTKVAPPRLDGGRVGVFATRAPHRPCPIGMSLVRINRIEGDKIYFSGVDMVDGTPVLDVKPYIPQYDNPANLATPSTPEHNGRREAENQERLVEGGTSSESPTPAETDDVEVPLGRSPSEGHPTGERGAASGERSEREAPDGEEGPVHVAAWVNNPATHTLEVIFSDRAVTQLAAVPDQSSLRATITRLLEQDPRSTYLRRKRGNQFYTFRIASQLVSVKFEDGPNNSVTVTSVQAAEPTTQ